MSWCGAGRLSGLGPPGIRCRLNHHAPPALTLDMYARSLTGSLAVRQSQMGPYVVVVYLDPCQYGRVLLLEAPDNLLAVPDGDAVEGLHLVVVQVAVRAYVGLAESFHR